MTFNNSDPANTPGVTIVGGSQITFTQPGAYNLQFSAQVQRSSQSGLTTSSIWLQRDFLNVPSTNTNFTLASSSTLLVVSWNWFVPITCSAPGVCQQTQIMWSTENEHVGLFATGAQTNPVRPSTPSVFLTVTQVR
jgi:hypothetical protein